MKAYLVFPILCIPSHEFGRSGQSQVFGSNVCLDLDAKTVLIIPFWGHMFIYLVVF